MPGVRTILVVDDEEIVRDVARAILKTRGYNVLVAGSGDLAMTLMRGNAHEICLMLLDASIAGWSGRNSAASLLGINPHLPVIVSSGFSPGEALQHLHAGRVLPFLQKPYTASQLRDAVSLALETRSMAA
jgi:two-component system, cell cycle sensor histidine kinase and response regulator CckA